MPITPRVSIPLPLPLPCDAYQPRATRRGDGTWVLHSSDVTYPLLLTESQLARGCGREATAEENAALDAAAGVRRGRPAEVLAVVRRLAPARHVVTSGSDDPQDAEVLTIHRDLDAVLADDVEVDLGLGASVVRQVVFTRAIEVHREGRVLAHVRPGVLDSGDTLGHLLRHFDDIERVRAAGREVGPSTDVSVNDGGRYLRYQLRDGSGRQDYRDGRGELREVHANGRRAALDPPVLVGAGRAVGVGLEPVDFRHVVIALRSVGVRTNDGDWPSDGAPVIGEGA